MTPLSEGGDGMLISEYVKEVSLSLKDTYDRI